MFRPLVPRDRYVSRVESAQIVCGKVACRSATASLNA